MDFAVQMEERCMNHDSVRKLPPQERSQSQHCVRRHGATAAYERKTNHCLLLAAQKAGDAAQYEVDADFH